MLWEAMLHPPISGLLQLLWTLQCPPLFLPFGISNGALNVHLTAPSNLGGVICHGQSLRYPYRPNCLMRAFLDTAEESTRELVLSLTRFSPVRHSPLNSQLPQRLVEPLIPR